MLSELCLCGLMLFADPGWARLDTSFLDMDPPMLSWSMTDAEFTEWEEAEYEVLNGHGPSSMDTGECGRPGFDALQMVRDNRASNILSGTRARRAVPALAR